MNPRPPRPGKGPRSGRYREAVLTGGKRKERGGRGGPRAVKDLLGRFLESGGLMQAMEDRRLYADWEEIVGPAAARETRPMRIEKEVLWIGVSNAPLANQLLYLKGKIIERIRSRYPQSRIRDVRVLHIPGEGWTRR